MITDVVCRLQLDYGESMMRLVLPGMGQSDEAQDIFLSYSMRGL
jgi:hypothetical protein